MASQNRGGKSRPGGSGRSGSGRPPAAGQRNGSGNGAAPRSGGPVGAEGAGDGPGTPGAGRAAAGTPPRRLGQQQASARPSAARPSASSAPRRLGQQPAGGRRPTSGAQRRSQRRRTSPNALVGRGAVVVVVVALLVIVLVKVTSSSSPTGNTSADRHPAAAPASIVNDLISTPLSTQSAAGIGAQTTSPYTLVKDYTPLTSTIRGGGGGTSSSGGSSSSGSGKSAAAGVATKAKKTVPRVAFVGAEFCPYCAVDRYALILGLSRLGTFKNLKVTQSGATDGDIPTFSFLGSTFTSKYLTFTPYEEEDRDRQTLQNPPANITKLWLEQTYASSDGQSEGGYPYANFAGKYVLLAFPSGMDQTVETLEGSGGTGSGLSRSQIVAGIHDPSSTYAQTIDGSSILSEANFVDGVVCMLDGGQPSNVCQASGVKAAMAVIAKATPTKL